MTSPSRLSSMISNHTNLPAVQKKPVFSCTIFARRQWNRLLSEDDGQSTLSGSSSLLWRLWPLSLRGARSCTTLEETRNGWKLLHVEFRAPYAPYAPAAFVSTGAVVVADSGAVVVADSGAVVVADSGAVVVADSGAVVVADSGAVVVADSGAVVVADSCGLGRGWTAWPLVGRCSIADMG